MTLPLALAHEELQRLLWKLQDDFMTEGGAAKLYWRLDRKRQVLTTILTVSGRERFRFERDLTVS